MAAPHFADNPISKDLIAPMFDTAEMCIAILNRVCCGQLEPVVVIVKPVFITFPLLNSVAISATAAPTTTPQLVSILNTASTVELYQLRGDEQLPANESAQGPELSSKIVTVMPIVQLSRVPNLTDSVGVSQVSI